VINLIILYLLVHRFLIKPIHKILDQRRQEVEEGYRLAAESQQKAEELKAQYEQAMEGVDEEKSAILKASHEQASRDYDKLITEAKEQAENILSNARINGEEEKQRRIKQAQEEITDIVARATTKLVVANDSAENDRALYQQFLQKAKAQKDTAKDQQ
jgi:F-type H+-transporting ATPase subunit b